ncbi:hypothetical protein EMPS_00983 [Entomortierella parvispora]|uniref:Uncharacterized protein n=1 Tax=Entomortierella parvispora TaxID=205924 RepID=A0A9P3H241_9FUNG|nr:hypothetical protein EMPS_00983 [Entomortierella parvispora]
MIFEQPDQWSTSSGDESDSEEPLQYDSDDLLHYSSDSDLASLSGLDSETTSLSASYPASPSQYQQEDSNDDDDDKPVSLFWEESTLSLSSLSSMPRSAPVSLASPQEIPTVTQGSIPQNHCVHVKDDRSKTDDNDAKVEYSEAQEPETFTAVEAMEIKDGPDLPEKPEPARSDRTRDQETKHEPVAKTEAVEADKEEHQTTLQRRPSESVPRTVQLYNADRDAAFDSFSANNADCPQEIQASASIDGSAIQNAPVVSVMITGAILTSDERTQVQDQVSRNFRVHHGEAIDLDIRFTHMDTPLPAEENERLKEFDLFVYLLPTAGVHWRDARTIIQLALVAPLVVVSGPDVDPVTFGDMKWELMQELHAARSVAIEDDGKLVRSITSSLITRKDLDSLSIQGIISRQSTIRASTPTDADVVSSALAYLHTRWQGLAELYPYTAMSYILAVVLLACLTAFLTQGDHQSLISQPAHARVQPLQFAQNGRVGIARVDYYTPQGSTFKPKHPYPLQVRVLGAPQVGPFRGSKMQDLPDVAEPIVQDLMNGTSKVYITSLRKRRRRYQDPNTLLSVHWACVEPTRYFLHMWFENGTQVSDTPLELIWPKNRKAAIAAETASEKMSDETEMDWEDDDDDLFKGLLSGPLSYALSDETRVWLEALVPRLRPVFCDTHAAVQWAIIRSMQSAKSFLSVVSVYFDYMFGTKDFIPSKVAILQQKAIHLFQRAESVATTKISSWIERLKVRKMSKERKDVAINLERKIQSVVEYVKVDLRARLSTKTAEPFLEKVDKVLSDLPNQFDPFLDRADKAFSELENRLDDLLRSKRVQEMTKNFQKDKILERADRVLAKAECRMEKAMKSKFVQRAQRRVQDKVEHLKRTAEGELWMRRWESWMGGVQSCSKKNSKGHSCGSHRR